MRTSDLIRSKFFRGADLKGRPPLIMTISTVTEELMGRPGGKMEPKYFLWFHEDPRGLQCNKSRVAVLELAYGPETDYWTGKRIRMSYDPTVMMAGELVGGIKVSTPAGIIWDPAQNPHAASWGDAPVGTPAAGADQPPKAVFNPQTGQWVLPPQRLPAPGAGQPPQPVKNPVTGLWELPPQKHVPPKTIGQRVAEGNPRGAGGTADRDWGGPGGGESVDTSSGEILTGNEEFDDDIPF